MSHDIILGLQYGDEGKGKVVYNLCQNSYTHCVRFNGGPNAGHTIYHNNNKIVTHQVPTGIFFDLTCIIGPGCVLDISKLKNEIEEIEKALGKNIRNNIKIAKNCHIITEELIQEDILNDKIGSTKSGIGPTYRNKYNRNGILAYSVGEKIHDCEIIDTYEELNKANIKILFEGAQGFMLDIDYGHYPYVTSSQCHIGMVVSSGISFKKINNVYGIAKIYNTYVGKMKFEPIESSKDYNTIQQLANIGSEYGSTTGRKRQCNWLNLDELKKAIIVNGVNILIFNKCDIIKQLNLYKCFYNNKLTSFNSFTDMKDFIRKHIDDDIEIKYSENKHTI